MDIQFIFWQKKGILGPMLKHKSRGSDSLFVETRLGIVTRTGDWFHTTSEHIREYVPGLLKAYSLEMLIKDAQAWVKSADSLALTLLMVLLFLINPWFAAILTLAFHWTWYNYKSVFVTRFLGKVLRVINSDIFLMVTAFLAISVLGLWHRYTAVVIAFVFFFILKLGLLKKGWDRLAATQKNKLTLNDRLLKMILIKYAMYENLAPTEVHQMEERFKNLASSRKKGRG